ncbi:MAG: hypothetical protein ACWGQW_20910 [bacterium]
MTKTLLMILGSLLFLPTELTDALAQSTVPPPLRVYIPFEAAWRGMREVFKERDWTIVEEDHARGILRSSFVEYSSGTLTKSHISKIGKRPESTDGDWIRVEYRYDIVITLIEAKETVVTVDADIRALKRSFLGDETWISIPSNGQRERYLLEEFGKLLFGQMFSLDKSKGGFWKLEPNYVPDMTTRAPVTNRDRP